MSLCLLLILLCLAVFNSVRRIDSHVIIDDDGIFIPSSRQSIQSLASIHHIKREPNLLSRKPIKNRLSLLRRRPIPRTISTLDARDRAILTFAQGVCVQTRRRHKSANVVVERGPVEGGDVEHDVERDDAVLGGRRRGERAGCGEREQAERGREGEEDAFERGGQVGKGAGG
jgi:hypothetical protein